jgi:hypothetical protein
MEYVILFGRGSETTVGFLENGANKAFFLTYQG